jgi:hypothetical protein
MSGTHFPSIYEKIPNSDHDTYDDDEDHALVKTKNSCQQSHLSGSEKECISHGQETGDEYLMSCSTPRGGGQTFQGNDEIELIPTAKSDVYGKHGDGTSYSYDFEMEEENEEETDDFARYSAVFSPTQDEKRGSLQGSGQKQGYHKATTPSWHSNGSYNCEENNYGWMKSSPVRRLIHKLHDARMESRRKRMERLLALPDGASIQNHKERGFLCFNTWCDLLDKGIFFIMFLLFLYIVILVTLGEEHVFVKKLMLGLGIPFFIFRISWRPLSWLVYEQRCDRVSVHDV